MSRSAASNQTLVVGRTAGLSTALALDPIRKPLPRLRWGSDPGVPLRLVHPHVCRADRVAAVRSIVEFCGQRWARGLNFGLTELTRSIERLVTFHAVTAASPTLLYVVLLT